ncbi:hypothetical protein SUGI_0687020 [Cryptomeria japonica]|nr:hypothetical protein SUGI_0687020 [Cryptomeria japonica]
MAEVPALTVVNVRRLCLVKPAIPTPTQTMFLSNVDLLWLPVNNVQNLVFYKISPLVDYNSLIEGLKKSLSSVLVYFYPLAGRLKIGESSRMEVNCNDEGVEFTEASINILFRDLERDGFQRKLFFQNLVHEVDPSENKNSCRPLLSIQVTAFEEGGICIGTTLHHVIADGNSFWHFMTSWAECSRGIPISKDPQHARAVLKRGKTNPSVSYKAHEIQSNGISGAKIFKFLGDDLEHLEMPVCGNEEKTRREP